MLIRCYKNKRSKGVAYCMTDDMSDAVPVCGRRVAPASVLVLRQQVARHGTVVLSRSPYMVPFDM